MLVLSRSSQLRRRNAVIKSLLVCIAFVRLVVGGPAHSQKAPPPSDQAHAVEALVTEAAALIEKDGKAAAFTQFRRKDSEWLHGDTYLSPVISRGRSY
jgi:hypothetical protein